MASFPTSVKTFTTRNAGDTIQPAHVNELGDEVTAIEDGLINGTAPIVSSRISAPASQITNSTVTNLSVTGQSTLASSVTIGAQRYIFPSSGGSTGDVLTCVSTSGSTMTLEWRATGAGVPTVKASARVDGSLALVHGVNVSGTSTIATGQVTVRFSSALASSVYYVAVTMAESGGRRRPTAYNLQSTGFQVDLWDDATPALVNAAFHAVVFST